MAAPESHVSCLPLSGLVVAVVVAVVVAAGVGQDVLAEGYSSVERSVVQRVDTGSALALVVLGDSPVVLWPSSC